MTPAPHRLLPPFDAGPVLDLIRDSFAYMDGMIDPPSSMHHLTDASITEQARAGEVWVIGTPPVACVFLTPRPGALYLGKLAVAAEARGRGLARQLVDLADLRARALGLPRLELQTRIELAQNHATFRAMGFAETGRSAHAGFDRPTTITFSRPVSRTVT